MKKLIEAFQIFAKYSDDEFPTHCEHDVMHVPVVNSSDVSKEDLERLEELGFRPDTEIGGFKSYKYGSC